MAGIVCDDLDRIMAGNTLISEIWAGNVLVYQYDSTAPALTVTAPAGTASGSPTYYTSGTTYRAQGAVSDAESGVSAVYVNGSAAVLSGNTWYKDITVAANTTVTVQVYAVDKAGNRSATITRYVRYDSAAPSLAVTTPTGTSSGAPTYTTGASYTVSGTVSDASGIRSVTVNGSAASVSSGKWSKALSLTANTTTTVTVVATDNAGRTTTVTRYVRYDSAAPTLAVTAPTGTSSSSPTYYQSDAAVSYTVSGTVSDASGIKSVTVNGSAVTVSSGKWSKALSLATNTTHTITVVATDNAGRTTTVNRYLRVEAYYQYAARLAGATPQASLDATLKNTTVMNAIAANATARSVMVTHYKTQLNSYLESNYSDSLNRLNYQSGASFYLLKQSTRFPDINGGFQYILSGVQNVTTTAGNVCFFDYGIQLQPYGGRTIPVRTTNAINISGYSSISITWEQPARYDGLMSDVVFTFGLMNSGWGFVKSAEQRDSSITSTRTITKVCDISTITGSYWIGFSGLSTTSPYGSQPLLYKIKLIKLIA